MSNDDEAPPAISRERVITMRDVIGTALLVGLLALFGGGAIMHSWYDNPKIIRLRDTLGIIRRAEVKKDSLNRGLIKEGLHADTTMNNVQREFKLVGVTGPFTPAESTATIDRIAYAECSKTTGKTCGPQKPTVVQAGMSALPEKSTSVTSAKRPKASPPKGKNQRAPKHFARNSQTKR